MTAVNNFIRRHGQDEIHLSEADLEADLDNNYAGDARVKEERSSPMAQKREEIADAMWKDYQRYLRVVE